MDRKKAIEALNRCLPTLTNYKQFEAFMGTVERQGFMFISKKSKNKVLSFKAVAKPEEVRYDFTNSYRILAVSGLHNWLEVAENKDKKDTKEKETKDTTVVVTLQIGDSAEQFKLKYNDIKMIQYALIKLDGCAKCPHTGKCTPKTTDKPCMTVGNNLLEVAKFVKHKSEETDMEKVFSIAEALAKQIEQPEENKNV